MLGASPGLGIDLGTCTLVVARPGEGVVLREPSLGALDRHSGRLLAVGQTALALAQTDPARVRLAHPLQNGVLAEYTLTSSILRWLFEQTWPQRRMLKPRVALSVSPGAGDVERRALLEAASSAGARQCWLVPSPVAVALGAGLPALAPQGNLVLDFGGGVTNLAIVACGGMVVGDSLRGGGAAMDEALMRHFKRRHSMLISCEAAEEIKITIGSAYPLDPELTMWVNGTDLSREHTRKVEVTSVEIREVIAEQLRDLLHSLRKLLERTPPDPAGDILEQGAVLTGGGANLRGLDKLVSQVLQLTTRVAPDPSGCAAAGAAKYLDRVASLTQAA